jgi:hypothetical protein
MRLNFCIVLFLSLFASGCALINEPNEEATIFSAIDLEFFDVSIRDTYEREFFIFFYQKFSIALSALQNQGF